MKRILLLFILASACRSAPIGVTPGSSNPKAAVEQMLAGAKNQDLQAISAVWGDENGLTRDRNPAAEVEARAFIIACVLKSDTQKLSEPSPAGNGRIIVTAELTQGNASGSTRFMTARTKDGRWLVQDVDLAALQNKGFCAR